MEKQLKRKQEFEAFVYDETSIRAAELCSPNSHEYEQLHEQLMEDRQWRLELARELRRRRLGSLTPNHSSHS